MYVHLISITAVLGRLIILMNRQCTQRTLYGYRHSQVTVVSTHSFSTLGCCTSGPTQPLIFELYNAASIALQPLIFEL